MILIVSAFSVGTSFSFKCVEFTKKKQVRPAFTTDLGLSSSEVGMFIVSEISLGPLQPFSASRLIGMAQILPHPHLLLVGESHPSLRENKKYDPFPRELRSVSDHATREEVYGEFFPGSPGASREWFVSKLL